MLRSLKKKGDVVIESIQGYEISPAQKQRMLMVRSHLEFIEKTIITLDSMLDELVKPYEDCISLLCTIPGVDRQSAITMADGEWIEDITTNGGGYAYSSALPLGDYYLVEKSVPDGYRLDETPHYFTLSYSWQAVYIGLVNECAGEPGRLRIIKTDEKENPLSGVTFGLYRAWDNKKLADLTTGADGTVESDLLIPQDYYLVELIGKPGYESNTGRIDFTVGQSGTTVVVVVVNPAERVFGKVHVIKQDDAGNLLPGARFGLYCSKGNLIQEMLTEPDDTATSGVLNAGDYYLVELAGIPGYVSDTQQHSVTISQNNVTVPITVINPHVTDSVNVRRIASTGAAFYTVSSCPCDKW